MTCTDSTDNHAGTTPLVLVITASSDCRSEPGSGH